MLKRLLKSEDGNVAVMFALALLPVVGVAGSAVDYARGSSARSKLQIAADAAALNAVVARVPTDARREAVAVATMQQYASDDAEMRSVATEASPKKVTVTATAEVKTVFMQLMQVDDLKFSARATAVKVFQGPPPCILALNKTVSAAIKFSGGADFVGEGCVVHSNSSSPSGLTFDGTRLSAKAEGFCSVGGVSASTTIVPTPESYCDEMEDPFRNVAFPTAGGCDYNNKHIPASKEENLPAGKIFCGGLTINGKVALEPGIYIVEGLLDIQAQAHVTGKGVTFFLKGKDAGFKLAGGSGLHLTAPTSGPYANILIMQDRLSNPGGVNSFTGGSGATLVGAIYTPTQIVDASGSGSIGQRAFMPIIADQVRISTKVTTVIPNDINLPAPLPRSFSGARLTH